MFSERWLNISWIAVDSADNIAIGKEKFSMDDKITFCDSQNFDAHSYGTDSTISILNISSTIQYIIEWEQFLEKLILDIKPTAVAITRVPTCIDAARQAYGIQHITTNIG